MDDGLEEIDEDREKCPICGRSNDPGAMDTCQHYVGLAWESDLIWGEEAERFSSLFGSLASLMEENEIEFEGFIVPISRSQALDESIKTDRLLDRSVWEYQAVDALAELLPTKDGEFRQTGGMLGGSGHSLYMDRPELLAEFNTFLEKLLKTLEESE